VDIGRRDEAAQRLTSEGALPPHFGATQRRRHATPPRRPALSVRAARQQSESDCPMAKMTFAIPVFVHPSNEFTMLWVGHPIPKNAPRRLGGAPEDDRLCCARLCNGAPSPTLAGRLARNDGGSPTGRPPCPDHPRRNRSSPRQCARSVHPWLFGTRPCLRWGACRRRFCAGMPEPCCLSVRITPNGGLGLS
jgi:hypothetical protein